MHSISRCTFSLSHSRMAGAAIVLKKKIIHGPVEECIIQDYCNQTLVYHYRPLPHQQTSGMAVHLADAVVGNKQRLYRSCLGRVSTKPGLLSTSPRKTALGWIEFAVRSNDSPRTTTLFGCSQRLRCSRSMLATDQAMQT